MRTVFHLSDDDRAGRAFGNAENLLADDTIDADTVALVVNGDAVLALLADGEYTEAVAGLLDDGVSIAACRNSLASRDLDAADLVDGVTVVPSGVGELTRLQADGHAYVKP